jgi:hypothetical protein
MVKDGIQLRVADARQRDVGHGKVRIDNETMKKLNSTAGDFVEIHYRRSRPRHNPYGRTAQT